MHSRERKRAPAAVTVAAAAVPAPPAVAFFSSVALSPTYEKIPENGKSVHICMSTHVNDHSTCVPITMRRNTFE